MSVLALIGVIAAVLGLVAIVAAVVLVLYRKAVLLEMQASVTRVEFLRLSRAYGVGRGE